MKLRLTESCPKTITCVVFLVFKKKKKIKTIKYPWVIIWDTQNNVNDSIDKLKFKKTNKQTFL